MKHVFALVVLTMYCICLSAASFDTAALRVAIETRLYRYDSLTRTSGETGLEHSRPSVLSGQSLRPSTHGVRQMACKMDLHFVRTGKYLSGSAAEIVEWQWPGLGWICKVDSIADDMYLDPRSDLDIRLLERGIVGYDSTGGKITFISGYYEISAEIIAELFRSSDRAEVTILLHLIYFNYRPKTLRWARTRNGFDVLLYSEALKKQVKLSLPQNP